MFRGHVTTRKQAAPHHDPTRGGGGQPRRLPEQPHGSNWKTASLFVSFLYTAENVWSLSSTLSLSLSFWSRITFSLLLPSRPMRVRFPTISVGPTTSSRMESCTAVSVRERGRIL